MIRVGMISPASSGTVLVPEERVGQFQARGWRLAESSSTKPTEEPESAPTKKAAPRKRVATKKSE